MMSRIRLKPEEIILEFLKGGGAVYGNQCNF